MGLPSDPLLQHGNKRIVYGIPLASNFRSYLLGIDKRPTYLIPQADPKGGTQLLVGYWRRRWLVNRIAIPAVLQKVVAHSLCYPIRHGAQVPLAEDDENSMFQTPVALGA